jgi:uncharacterized heparinase superfamily protein
LKPSVSFPEYDPWNEAFDLRKGVLSFLNETRNLGRPINWQPDASLLWQFNLHYFNYLYLLDDEMRADFCRDWVESNPVGSEPGWHPYSTSLRVINWCKAGFESEDILQSLYQQSAYLHRNLETHLLGNHLLENARALVFAGCFFEGRGEASDWLSRGLEIYREQTPEQILGDGAHFERSPMYHAIMLEGYLDVLNLLPDDHRDRSWLHKTVREMCDFLFSVTHPDGHIALFNDATREIACSTEALLDYADRVMGYRPSRVDQFDEAGYYIHASDRVFLLIDGGHIGPDYLPAHAHADIFSYELSVGGIPFIVDSGVYEYEEGGMREYVRSTQAHNTVGVDGVDQAECWGGFRVARRYPPRDVSFDRQGQQSVFEGRFEGYAHLIGDQIEHHRRIETDDREGEIRIEDTVTGQGQHSVESRIHLHPDVQTQCDQEGIQLERAGREVYISTGDSTVRFENGWYCPEFGLRESNTVIVLGGDHSLPAHLRYSIRY